MEHTQSKVDNARAYDKNCIGCKNHGGEIMVSITDKDESGTVYFHDYFLSTDQAEYLANEILKRLEQNKIISD